SRARPRTRWVCWAVPAIAGLAMASSCDLASELVEQAMQVPVLIGRWLVAVHGARSHIVDEFVVPGGEPMLLALDEQRDLGPFEFPVSIPESPCPVLLAFRRPYALGV